MIIGIDLGTTNSLVAVWQDGEARIIPNALGEVLTPSVVGLDESGEVLVGRAARDRLLTQPDLTAAAFKRYMGTDRRIYMGRRGFRPEELSALVLKVLKADAEAWLGETVTEAVISVPAYFNDTQRKATRIAGEMAGFKVERLINEPTAAALAYGLHAREAERKFLVFDLGGGTFDVSILELFEGIMEVRASAGDNFLGGEDFVDCLVAGFLKTVGEPAGIEDKHVEGGLLQDLRNQAERAKYDLTRREGAEMRLRWRDEELRWRIDEETFETLSEPLLGRLRTPIERALRDARIPVRELDEMILVGGASRMPIIRQLAARLFGRLPAGHLNPDEAIALGAAVQAGLKARDAALDEVVMTDVCPYTLGTGVSQSFGRNTTIPASRVERVVTAYNQQTSVLVGIYQGESRRVEDNIRLGELSIKVPPKPAGEESIDVRFTYDINGLLEVNVTVVSIGETKNMVIEQNPGAMSPKEIEQSLKALAALKIHPREQSENRAVLARAERLYQERLGDLRDLIGTQISAFEAILARQKPQEIDEAREMLAALLDEIEGESYF